MLFDCNMCLLQNETSRSVMSSFVWVSIVFTIGLNATRVARCAMIPSVVRLQKKWWPHQTVFGNLSFNLSPPFLSHFMVFYASHSFCTSIFPSSSFLCPPIFGLNKTSSVSIDSLSCNRCCSGKNSNYYTTCVCICSLRYPAKEKNQCIRQKTGAQNIVQEIKQYQEKWLQHVQRMDTNRLPKQTLQYKPKARRNIGRLRKRWRGQLYLEDQGTGNMPDPSGIWWWWWWWWCYLCLQSKAESNRAN